MSCLSEPSQSVQGGLRASSVSLSLSLSLFFLTFSLSAGVVGTKMEYAPID